MYIFNYRQRSKLVFSLLFLFLLLSLARLFFIQFFRSGYLLGLARRQHSLFVELEPKRGTIYDRNLRPLAVNVAVDSLYGCPNSISDKEKDSVARQLSSILGQDYGFFKERLSRKKVFVWLARKITPQQSAQLKQLNIKGIGFMKESKRCYPHSYLLSHVLGFAGLDNTGLEAVELYYDKYLKGQSGYALFFRDAHQKKLDLWEKMVLPKDGYDLVLTIDGVIQYIAEREIEKIYRKSRAKAATIVVMEPLSGAILALANRPTYDLNEYAQARKDNLRNRAICDMFEPGSVFKIVTASAALEEKVSLSQERFFCENGSYRVVSHTLHDHRPHGWLAFREVFEQSSNIGTVKIAQDLGAQPLYRYMRLFGFGSKTGVDLPGEISGVAKEPRQWSKISIAAIPIGQEVGVTALQLANAISALANKGRRMRPYILQSVKDKFGQTIKEIYPLLVQEVVSAETAETLKDILRGVVENGTGKMARLKGFAAAGKTGTAQKVDPDGRYSHDKYIASFIGFAPLEDPRLAVVVMVDEPRPSYFGGVVAAPVFKKVVDDALRYLNVTVASEQFVAWHETKGNN